MGSYNVFVKQSIHKAGLMDPVREVVELVNNIENTKKENVVVITYDPVLTYYLAKSESYKSLTIFSPYIKESSKLLVSVKTYLDIIAALILILKLPSYIYKVIQEVLFH